MVVGNGENNSEFLGSSLFRQKHQVSFGSVKPLQSVLDLLNHADSEKWRLIMFSAKVEFLR